MEKSRKDHQAFAFKLIDYYLNVAKCNKITTLRYFRNKKNSEDGYVRSRSNIYKIIERYEKKGTVLHTKRSRPSRHATDSNNLEKMRVLVANEPKISVREAAHLLNVSRSSVLKMKKMLRAPSSSDKDKDKMQEIIDKNHILVKSEPEMDVFEEESDHDHHSYSFEEEFSGEKEVHTGAETPGKNSAHMYPRQWRHGNDRVGGRGKIAEKLKKAFAIARKRQFKPKSVRGSSSVPLGVGGKDEERCLICCDDITDDCRDVVSVSLPKYHPKNSLKANSKTYFLLKKILEIPSDEMVKIMEASNGKCPSEWVKLCDRCWHIVDEAIFVQEQLNKLERRMMKCKNLIVQSIMKSSRRVTTTEPCRKRRMNFIPKKVRDLVCQGNVYPGKELEALRVLENSFKEGDDQAERLISLMNTGGNFEKPANEHTVLREAEQSASFLDMDIGDTNVGDENFQLEFLSLDSVQGDPNPIASPIASLGGTELESEPCKEDAMVTINTKMEVERELNSETNQDSLSPEKGKTLERNVSTPSATQQRLICDMCGEVVKNISLAMHKLRRHGVVMDGCTLFRCEFEGCKYTTTWKDAFRGHIKRHVSNRPRPHVCQFCGKGFLKVSDLKEHETIHLNAESKPFKCDICFRTFALENYMNRHKKLNHKDLY